MHKLKTSLSFIKNKKEPEQKELNSLSSGSSTTLSEHTLADSNPPTEDALEQNPLANDDPFLADSIVYLKGSLASIQEMYSAGKDKLVVQSKNTGITPVLKMVKQSADLPPTVIKNMLEILKYQLSSALNLNNTTKALKFTEKAKKALNSDNEALLEFYKLVSLELGASPSYKSYDDNTKAFIQQNIINPFVFLATTRLSSLIEEGKELIIDSTDAPDSAKLDLEKKMEEIDSFIKNIEVNSNATSEMSRKAVDEILSLNSQNLHQLFQERAIKYHADKDYEGARSLYQRSLKFATTDEEQIAIHVLSAKNEGLSGQNDEAKKELIQAIKLGYPRERVDNDNFSAQDLINLGSAYFAVGNNKEGISICQQLIAIEGKTAENASATDLDHTLIAKLFYQCGNAEEHLPSALNYWTKSLKEDFVETRASHIILKRLQPNVDNCDEGCKKDMVDFIELYKKLLVGAGDKSDRVDIEWFYIDLLKDLKEYDKAKDELFDIAWDPCHIHSVIKQLKPSNAGDTVKEKLTKSGKWQAAQQLDCLLPALEQMVRYATPNQQEEFYRSPFLRDSQDIGMTMDKAVEKPYKEFMQGMINGYGVKNAVTACKFFYSLYNIPMPSDFSLNLAEIMGEASLGQDYH